MSRTLDRRGRITGFAAALTAVAIWAGWIPVTRLAVTVRLTPGDVAAIRFGISALLLLPVLARNWRAVPWRRPLVLVVLVVGAGVPYQLLFGTGLLIANSGQAAVLGPGLVSSLVALLAALFLGERLGSARLVGLGVTLLGVAAVLAHDLATGHARFAGYAMIVAASTHWAAFTVASRVLGLRPLVNAALVAVANALGYLPIYFATGGAARLAALPTADLAVQGVYQGVVTAIVALIAFATAVERLGAAAAASLTPLAPVLVALFGWFLLGDRVDVATAVGLAAVALGVLIANRGAAPAAAT